MESALCGIPNSQRRTDAAGFDLLSGHGSAIRAAARSTFEDQSARAQECVLGRSRRHSYAILARQSAGSSNPRRLEGIHPSGGRYTAP